jgi:SAM-dependent methyltransferase
MVGRMTDQDAVARVYDEHATSEYERLDRSALNRAEFTLTTELIDEYVVPGATVLDVGAGPGRYAEYLVGRGCDVGLTDLSARSLELFSQRVGSAGVLFCRQGSATELGWVSPGAFDAVLMMGPLYHLVSRDERRAALDGAWRALRPGGVLIASYISPYKPLSEAVARGDLAEVERLRDGGSTLHAGAEQYRSWPSASRDELAAAGFDVLHTRNIQGLASLLPVTTTDAQDPAALLAMLRTTSTVPDLIGATLHYSHVGRRP